MKVTFGQLYADLIELEKGYRNLERDVQNASCDYATKCIMEDELFRLGHKIDALMNLDLDFEEFDFMGVLTSIQECIACVELGLEENTK